ncbi:short-chain dehydrogenase [Rhodococcus sp. ACPA4]|jgi:short-subunit dehydrogenase|nr:short-chain dehydrogenase [Rhodococcus sp. ACPA4]
MLRLLIRVNANQQAEHCCEKAVHVNSNDFVSRYGPVALVTGASSGIGQSFAEQLAAMGLDVVLVARRESLLGELASRLRAEHGVEVTVCSADLAEVTATASILDATSGLDIGLVVSNAGYGFKGEHSAMDPAELADMVTVNCTTPMLLTRGFIPRLRARGRGGIIVTSSIEALLGCPYSTAYSSSKAFLNSLGEGLWGELTPEGIDVLTICPGATDTEALRRSGIDPATMNNVMSPDEVVTLTLDNIDNGPTLFPSDHHKAVFDQLLSIPRRDALTAMARGMKVNSVQPN